jgi:hypothetical protein
MDKPDRPQLQLISVDDPAFSAALDRQIAEMRFLLGQMQTDSPAVALKTLREAFPEVPLEARVRAMTATRH